MATAFNGTLNPNEIFSALFNMIISQQVYSGFLTGLTNTLVEKNRVDGSMYGDTKLYYATDVMESRDWLNDAEASNLLNVNRPKNPNVQKLTLNIFRQIDITTDQYLSKRAWMDEGAFGSFISVTLGWMRDTKKVYETTLMNVYVGTTESQIGKQHQDVDISTLLSSITGEEKNRMKASLFGQAIADALVEIQDVGRSYNDLQYMRAYALDELMIVWNSAYINQIRYVDLPSLFHKDGILSEDKISQITLASRYFGVWGDTKVAKASNDGTFRSTVEADYATAVGQTCTHVFPGDLIPAASVKVLTKTRSGDVYKAATVVADADAIAANEYYTPTTDIVCKIMKKNGAVPFMSGFEVETSFYNPRSLTENHYLTWAHNTLEYLANYPLVTIEED